MDESTSFCNSLSNEKLAQAIDKSMRADNKRWPGCFMDDMETTTNKLREWFPTRAEEIDSLLQTLNTTDGYIDWDAWYDSIPIVGKGNNDQTRARKIIYGRHLYITKGGKIYTIDGKRVK